MASNKYMTVDQLAERWMCSPSYVRTLLRSGQLSAVKLAGWKVRQDEVLRFEKAKEQAENHYPEYEKFEVQAIEIERRSK